jgi:hypothetical protein
MTDKTESNKMKPNTATTNPNPNPTTPMTTTANRTQPAANKQANKQAMTRTRSQPNTATHNRTRKQPTDATMTPNAHTPTMNTTKPPSHQPDNTATTKAPPPPPVAIPRPIVTRYRCQGGAKISFVFRPDVPTIEGPYFSKGPAPSFAEQVDALFKTTRNTAHDQGGQITLRMKLPSGRTFTITAEPEGSKQTAEIDRP